MVGDCRADTHEAEQKISLELFSLNVVAPSGSFFSQLQHQTAMFATPSVGVGSEAAAGVTFTST